ncbi:TetR-like C-terminal domain-containing protein, partial [Micromonospora sp. 4G55]|uniref:TetR-like C-terminal domain-containing protein n=1 Tax=Micromonospora sp. 4G55 TaxID=2806102 RepID=UPI001A4DA26B
EGTGERAQVDGVRVQVHHERDEGVDRARQMSLPRPMVKVKPWPSGLTGDAAVDAARLFRSAVHGFVTLEAAGGFGLPRGIDRSFDQLVAALDTAYRDWRS